MLELEDVVQDKVRVKWGQNPCVPPVHNETVAVPHHIYTVHSQPQINRWMTNEVGCTQTPVTQEVRTQQHQTLDSCNGR